MSPAPAAGDHAAEGHAAVVARLRAAGCVFAEDEAALLVAAAPASPVLYELLPFLKGMTLLFWATATWWIPMLVILGIWRHLIRRFPLRYDPLYWGAVFPLGMYTVSTYRLGQVVDVPVLMAIPRLFIWVALLAWTAALVGLIHDLVRHRA